MGKSQNTVSENDKQKGSPQGGMSSGMAALAGCCCIFTIIPAIIFLCLIPVWIVYLSIDSLWPIEQAVNVKLCKWAGWGVASFVIVHALLPFIFEVIFKMMCCPGGIPKKKPKNCWVTIDSIHGFFDTIFSLLEAALAVYGAILLKDMNWTTTTSVWFKFSMVAIDVSLWFSFLKWFFFFCIRVA